MKILVLNVNLIVILFLSFLSVDALANTGLPVEAENEKIVTEVVSKNTRDNDYLEEKLQSYRERAVEYEIKKRELQKKIELDSLLLQKAKLDAELQSVKSNKNKTNLQANSHRVIVGQPVKKSSSKTDSSKNKIQLISMYEVEGGIYADFVDKTDGGEYKGIIPGEHFAGKYSYRVVNGLVELRYRK